MDGWIKLSVSHLQVKCIPIITILASFLAWLHWFIESSTAFDVDSLTQSLLLSDMSTNRFCSIQVRSGLRYRTIKSQAGKQFLLFSTVSPKMQVTLSGQCKLLFNTSLSASPKGVEKIAISVHMPQNNLQTLTAVINPINFTGDSQVCLWWANTGISQLSL